MQRPQLVFFGLSFVTWFGCSSPEAPPASPECAEHSDCTDPAAPFCDAASESCVEAPAGSELGWGDGSASSVVFTVIAESDLLRQPTDLEFNPSKTDELWVTNYLDDSVVVITEPGLDSMSLVRLKDPATGHFMHRPPALAFGGTDPAYGQTFGTCGDGNDGGDDFMGPALFTANLDIYATQNPDTGLGSHLDMLHSTDFCRGIAHAENNVFFVFNSEKGSVDKYDFGAPHGPGEEDHSDGRIERYVAGSLLGVDHEVSHLAYDAESKVLYVADSGHGRIFALDTTTGTLGKNFPGEEFIKERRTVDGATGWDVVPAGTVTEPTGLELYRSTLFVADAVTSRFYAFDTSGTLIGSLDTGLPAGSLAGLNFGPDGKLYFVDRLGGRVLRIDPIP